MKNFLFFFLKDTIYANLLKYLLNTPIIIRIYSHNIQFCFIWSFANYICCKLSNDKSLFRKIHLTNITRYLCNSTINFHFFLFNFFICKQAFYIRVNASNNKKSISVHFTHLLMRASLLLSLLLLSFLFLFLFWKFCFFALIGITNIWCMYFFFFFIFIFSQIMHKFIAHYFFFCINLMLYLIIHSFNQFLIFIND